VRTKTTERSRFALESTPWRWALAAAVVALPFMAWAGTGTEASTQSTGPDFHRVGRVLGMVLFAYLILKWANRKKDRDDDEPRSFLGQHIKPWVVWLVVIGGLGLLMARSG
jgi:hypothetical protein